MISSFCGTGTCVEVDVAKMDDGLSEFLTVTVRNSAAPNTGCRVAFTAEEWRAFVAGVKNGEFDV